jgi:predicted DNA repair protein MutK
VRGMPYFLTVLSGLGTAAMIWVGGGIILHGLEEYGLDWLPHLSTMPRTPSSSPYMCRCSALSSAGSPAPSSPASSESWSA